MQYGLVCGGGGVSGCHMAFICEVVSEVLLQWNGVGGGRGVEWKKGRVGWVENVVEVVEVGLGGCGRLVTSMGTGVTRGARRPRWARR